MQKIQVKIGRFEETYVVAVTTAPPSFDGFGTFTLQMIGRNELKPQETDRMVLVPEPTLEWQTMRNSSGLHPTWTEEGDNAYCGTREEHITALLVERLTGKKQ